MKSSIKKVTVRTLAFLGITIVGLVSAGCPSQRTADLPFKTGTLEYFEGGGLKKAKLVQDSELNGIHCRRWVHYHENGNLHGVELASDQIVGRNTLPNGSFLWFDEEARLKTAWLSEDVEIQGMPCRGGIGKVATGFHSDGSLRSFYPRDSLPVDGILCKASLFAPISLHPNGRLASCRLAQDTDVDGQVLKAKTQIKLDPGGRLLTVD